ncbi:unnamed protein product [Didymodactylos carnosus]|uniref:Uncharacterized protein n=1 Tax=Didymodactylos carnosus TaxID=1234261 RepID=A0A8S2RH74_9BILA|nr:unnamed protein product [Didymodactylos carnosus]CAF4163113.1 unnamed protein product [Didymodactylos carnosus]
MVSLWLEEMDMTELANHADQQLVQFLVEGFMSGFDIDLSELLSTSFQCKNNRSARDAQNVVDDLIKKDLKQSYMTDPLVKPPFDIYRISPIGVAYGKYNRKPRLIVDLSAPYNYPSHASINSLIDKEEFSLSYVRLDHALQVVNSLGVNTSMVKTDIVDAFKIIPVKPELRRYLGICWNGFYYFYTRLVFGSGSSLKIL